MHPKNGISARRIQIIKTVNKAWLELRLGQRNSVRLSFERSRRVHNSLRGKALSQMWFTTIQIRSQTKHFDELNEKPAHEYTRQSTFIARGISKHWPIAHRSNVERIAVSNNRV